MAKDITFEQFKKDILGDPKPWYVYLVRCSDNSLYCGITMEVKERVIKHNNGNGAKYINKKRVPVSVEWTSDPLAKGEALKMEYKIKTLSKLEKEKMCQEWLSKQEENKNADPKN
jgi:putative endonuclease